MTFAWWHPIVALLPMLSTFWSIWHILNHSFPGNLKIYWLIAVVFLPVLGGIAYIFTGRRKAMPLSGKIFNL